MHIHGARLERQKGGTQADDERTDCQSEEDFCSCASGTSPSKQDHDHPEEWEQRERCPKGKPIIRQPRPAFAEEETREGSSAAKSEEKEHAKRESKTPELMFARQNKRKR